MFEDALMESGGKIRTQRGWFSGVAAVCNGSVLCLLVLWPLLQPASLPRQTLNMLLTAPAPPAAPMPRMARVVSIATHLKTLVDPFTPPRIIPNQIRESKDAPPAIATGLGLSLIHISIQPGQPKVRYMSESSSWYGALAATHSGIDIVDARGDLSRYRMVAAPLMSVLDEEQAKRIRGYVEQGGTFVAGFRLGVKDSESRIVATPLPGLLREVMGVTVEDYVPIYGGPVGVQFRASLAGADGHAERWADLLKPDGAEVLATYTGSDYADKAAITMHRMGKGRAVYIGADLDAVSLSRVLAALAVEAGMPHVEVPRGVERTRRRAGGVEWTFLLNHSAEEQSVVIGQTMRDVVGGQSVTGAVKLAPYGVSVLRSA